MYHARPLRVCAHSLFHFWPIAAPYPERERLRMAIRSSHSINIISHFYRLFCLLILSFAFMYVLSAQRFFPTGILAGVARLAGPTHFVASQPFQVQSADDCHANDR